MALRQPESKELRHAIENIIQNTNTFSSTTGTVGNGQNATFTITVTNNAKAETLTQLDITLYQDSVSSVNQFQGGSNISMGAWIFLGPYSDYASDNRANTVYKFTAVNVSAGNHTLTLQGVARVIANTLSTVAIQT